MMTVGFSCRAATGLSPEAISAQILDVERWKEFSGYWPIPGIREARFERRTPEIVGSRISVTNRDGSTHVEEITVWESHRITLVMSGFSPPLSRLATQIVETWEFSRQEEMTLVRRTLEIHPRFALAKAPLWLIARLLRRAIARHLREIAEQPPAHSIQPPPSTREPS